MARIKVGVDVDGVLANFCGGARTIAKQMFDGRPSDDLIQTGWSFSSIGISDAETQQIYNKIDDTPNWWEDLSKLPFTEALRSLCDYARVVFITDRKDGKYGNPIEVQTQNWLVNNFHLFRPNVVISGNKGDVAKGLELDFYIDDRPKNVDGVRAIYPKCHTYLFNATYNQECQGPRVYSFNEFASLAVPDMAAVYPNYGRCA